MLPLILIGLGAAGLVYAVTRESVPEGALSGCAFNGQNLHTWGEANGVTILISDPSQPDGYNSVGANNSRAVLYWTPGDRVLMVRTPEGDFYPDWLAVNSYCKFNLARGNPVSDQPLGVAPNTFKLVNKVNGSILRGGFKPL